LTRTIVLACATVIEEMLPIIPPEMHHEVFDFGLHINPQKLKETLQAAINEVKEDIDTIILGYGLCSQAMIGIKSERCTVVVPRVDDCIAIFLGSLDKYKQQTKNEPGTYYLTKGWIEVGDTPFKEHEETIKRYGEKRAEKIFRIMMANYKRLALINTRQYEIDKYREYTQNTAQKFNLRYEEIQGSNDLIVKMLNGDWAEEFVVVGPGEAITYNHFYPF